MGKGKKLSPNAACPCGSGEKYKHCCLSKGLEWRYNDAGELCRVMPLSAELVDAFQTRKRELEESRGAPLEPNDLLFPEFAEMSEAQVTEHIAGIMTKAGMDPAQVYAFEQTGLLVSDSNIDMIPVAELAEWETAVHEFRAWQN